MGKPSKPQTIEVHEDDVRNLPPGRYRILETTVTHYFDVADGVAERSCDVVHTLERT